MRTSPRSHSQPMQMRRSGLGGRFHSPKAQALSSPRLRSRPGSAAWKGLPDCRAPLHRWAGGTPTPWRQPGSPSRSGGRASSPGPPTPAPIVPDPAHLGRRRRRPGRGAGGKLPAAREARSVTAAAAKADPATPPPTPSNRRGRGRVPLLARQRGPRRRRLGPL